MLSKAKGPYVKAVEYSVDVESVGFGGDLFRIEEDLHDLHHLYSRLPLSLTVAQLRLQP